MKGNDGERARWRKREAQMLMHSPSLYREEVDVVLIVANHITGFSTSENEHHSDTEK